MKIKDFKFLFAGMVCCCLQVVNTFGQASITKANIAFIDYPDFPEGESTWDDIGYSTKFNKVVAGVTNHKDKVALFDYDVATGKMTNNGLMQTLGNLREFQWQAKIHSKIKEGPDGYMYFATDGGESREEYLMDHPAGYAGGFFMKWHPQTKKLVNLGMGLQYESIKDIDIDPESGKLYDISYPQVHFTVYDPAKNTFKDMGRLGSAHVPRVMFTDWWGDCYYVDWRQRLVKYQKSNDSLVFARNSVPAFEGTPGGKIITGITAYAKDQKNGVIYFVTYGAKIVAFYPRKDGIGKMVDLGGVADSAKNIDAWGPYVPNLNIGNNGKLYYIVGGHGNFIIENKTVLMEFDPATKKHTLIYQYPVEELSEATGSDTKDKDGNLYFAGRKDLSSRSIPFLIKFNPGKNVKK
ncbi:MAG: hypothetical protein JWR61_5771 [Ferruginibacter sp.]|uniref:hypothetical protein n=1 Tax=Ferruginibacter sp. TaxID=1940288 RepID=UPI00265B6ABE|nr:hypothetical protein [Ferruginibacter sp.]MDB5280816.1 hypothetical protein [Ferruginibacter sp.]